MARITKFWVSHKLSLFDLSRMWIEKFKLVLGICLAQLHSSFTCWLDVVMYPHYDSGKIQET
jgi:hypothetical protein